jgi:hypothetical protein
VRAALRKALADITNPAFLLWSLFLDAVVCLIFPHWNNLHQLLTLFGLVIAFQFAWSLTRSAHNALKQ